MHFAEKLDRFISNAGNPFSRSEAKKFKPEVNALGFFICGTPHTEPTAWDPSAIEPTLPYPHIARLSPGFLFAMSGRCFLASFHSTQTAPRFFGGDMAKRMQDKESIAGVSWLIVLALSCWGGLVRYLIDVKQNKATRSWINALAQIAVSGFTGLIGGLISVESGLSLYMILVTSGISGAMGSVALTYFWERLTGMKNANQ